jgi:hypothetical protein
LRDVEINRRGRVPGDNQRFKTGAGQFGSQMPTRVGVSIGARGRGFERDVVARGGGRCKGPW